MGKLLESNGTILKQLNLLKRHIINNKICLPKTLSKFVFLCGANKVTGEASERRKALMVFSKEHLPDTHFFLAEKVFEILQAEGHKANQLDIENEISIFADSIIIVLESPSSFAELGAFAHKDLRKKLIVINDKNMSRKKSFINLGPIKAIKDAGKVNNVILYKMDDDGVNKRDGIGDVYMALYEHFKEDRLFGAKNNVNAEIDPAKNFNKYSLMFVHDLVYICGPIQYAELIGILKVLFGDQSYDKLKVHLGMLSAIDAITRDDNSQLYESSLNKLYLKYGYDVYMTIATFRHIYQKFMPERIYGN